MNQLIQCVLFGLCWVSISWALPREAFTRVSGVLGLAFLAWIDPFAAGILLVSSTTTFFAVHRITNQNGTWALIMSVSLLTLLFAFKYGALWIPLGMSYFIFRQIGYTLEVYKGEIKKGDYWTFLAYQTLVPVLFIGPIHRYNAFERDVRRRRWDPVVFNSGLMRIPEGIFKMAFMGNYMFSHLLPKYIDELDGMAYVYCESVRFVANTYFQFAGFSDVAIGLAAMGGIRVMENFNNPFFAQNISDFWQRWHISLSSWCRDYIYMPVFASTRNAAFALFLSIGLLAVWHAVTWNYLLWGLSHILATLVYRTWVNRGGQTWLRTLHPATLYIGHLLTFHFVVFSWSIIHFETLGAWIYFLKNGLNIHGTLL